MAAAAMVVLCLLTPMMALSSVMVTCLARSTAAATCCWCWKTEMEMAAEEGYSSGWLAGWWRWGWGRQAEWAELQQQQPPKYSLGPTLITSSSTACQRSAHSDSALSTHKWFSMAAPLPSIPLQDCLPWKHLLNQDNDCTSASNFPEKCHVQALSSPPFPPSLQSHNKALQLSTY